MNGLFSLYLSVSCIMYACEKDIDVSYGGIIVSHPDEKERDILRTRRFDFHSRYDHKTRKVRIFRQKLRKDSRKKLKTPNSTDT